MSDELAALDFAPQCAWAETEPAKRCPLPARFGYVWSCSCASVYCGEHDAQVNRDATVMVNCPRHGAVRQYSRKPLVVTP